MWCFHDRLKQFTFSNGLLIKCCPDCTAFDVKRIDALTTTDSTIPTDKQQDLHWKFVLDEAGLNEHSGTKPWLEYAGNLKASLDIPYVGEWQEWPDVVFALKTMLKQKRQRTIPKTTLDDHEWVARQRPFPHTHEMPRRFTSYCTHCTEVVLSVKRPWVVRITKGVYLPIEHECNSVRVYNLQGNLIEVKAQ